MVNENCIHLGGAQFIVGIEQHNCSVHGTITWCPDECGDFVKLGCGTCGVFAACNKSKLPAKQTAGSLQDCIEPSSTVHLSDTTEMRDTTIHR